MVADECVRYVVEHSDGWAVAQELDERPGVLFPTQAEALKQARALIRDAGGGLLIVRRLDGQIRVKARIGSGAEERAAGDNPGAVWDRQQRARLALVMGLPWDERNDRFAGADDENERLRQAFRGAGLDTPRI